MSDENKVEIPWYEKVSETGYPDTEQVDVKADESTNEPEYSEVEVAAMEKGWRPKEEWEGPEDDWRSAKEFMERGELYSSISNLKHSNKETKEALRKLAEHHKAYREQEARRITEALERQKAELMQDGNYYEAQQIDKQINQVTEDYEKEAESLNIPEDDVDSYVSPELDAFKARNAWFDRDQEMRQEAMALGIAHKTVNPNATDADIFNYIEKNIKKIYPEKFGKASAPPVESNRDTRTTNTGRKPKYTINDLDPDTQRVAHRMVSSGAFNSVQEYVDEYMSLNS